MSPACQELKRVVVEQSIKQNQNGVDAEVRVAVPTDDKRVASCRLPTSSQLMMPLANKVKVRPTMFVSATRRHWSASRSSTNTILVASMVKKQCLRDAQHRYQPGRLWQCIAEQCYLTEEVHQVVGLKYHKSLNEYGYTFETRIGERQQRVIISTSFSTDRIQSGKARLPSSMTR